MQIGISLSLTRHGSAGGGDVPAGARATEDDEIRLTEDDEIRVVED